MTTSSQVSVPSRVANELANKALAQIKRRRKQIYDNKYARYLETKEAQGWLGRFFFGAPLPPNEPWGLFIKQWGTFARIQRAAKLETELLLSIEDYYLVSDWANAWVDNSD